MAQTLMQKVGLLLSSTMYDIVNRALHENPIASLKEVLRQHEEALSELNTNLGFALGRVKSEDRHVKEQQFAVESIDAEIQRILTDGNPNNDGEADIKAEDLIGQEDILDTKKQTFEAARNGYNAILLAQKKMNSRVTSLTNQISLLESIKSEADIKGMTADILIKSARLVSDNAMSVESYAESVKRNRDKQEARYELAMQDLSATTTDDDVQRRAKERIAQIRTRNGLQTPGEATADTDDSLDMTPEDLQKLSASS